MNARLNRLFAADGRCFGVAADHGFFGEGPSLAGLETMEWAILTLVEAAPDAIQLSPGEAQYLQCIKGPQKPALVLRTDVANVYGGQLPRHVFSELVAGAVEQALRLDAACVVCSLLQLPDHPELFHQCVRNVSALRATCDTVGMPLMVEPLVMQQGGGGHLGVDGDVEKIVPLVRQAVELGADVVKADPTDDIGDAGRVIEIAGNVPVLVRGGGRTSDEEVLRLTEAVMDQGAAGIVHGRNITQHDDPVAMTRAVMGIVHDAMPAAQALSLLRG